MNIIETEFFTSQLKKLKKKYSNLDIDVIDFKDNIKLEPFSNLGNGVYKFRMKNSSIPTGKRSGFRIIILFLDKENIIPLLIYSKNSIENISNRDITYAKNKVLKELSS